MEKDNTLTRLTSFHCFFGLLGMLSSYHDHFTAKTVSVYNTAAATCCWGIVWWIQRWSAVTNTQPGCCLKPGETSITSRTWHPVLLAQGWRRWVFTLPQLSAIGSRQPRACSPCGGARLRLLPTTSTRGARVDPTVHPPSLSPGGALRPVLLRGGRRSPEAAGGQEAPGRTKKRPRLPSFTASVAGGSPSEPKMAAGAKRKRPGRRAETASVAGKRCFRVGE